MYRRKLGLYSIIWSPLLINRPPLCLMTFFSRMGVKFESSFSPISRRERMVKHCECWQWDRFSLELTHILDEHRLAKGDG